MSRLNERAVIGLGRDDAVTSRDYKTYSISGDWTDIGGGLRVRIQDAPNEEDMEHYDPRGVVILQVQRPRAIESGGLEDWLRQLVITAVNSRKVRT